MAESLLEAVRLVEGMFTEETVDGEHSSALPAPTLLPCGVDQLTPLPGESPNQ